MTRVMLRDSRIVTAADDCVADILVEDGRIRAIGLALTPDGGTGIQPSDHAARGARA